MNVKVFVIIISLWPLSTYCVIDYSILLEDSQDGKSIYCLGDNHSKLDRDENIHQLELLKTQLHAHEDRAEPLSIFIENPSTLAKKSHKSPSVLLSLYDHVRNYNLSHVLIEDIDVRRTANAAYFLLSTHYPGFDYSQPFNDDCLPLDSIRFKDVYHEYASITKHIKSWVPPRTDSILCSEINDLVELSSDNKNSFRRNLRKLNISENDMIFNTATTLGQEEETFLIKDTLAGDLYNTFAPLLEAHTLQKIRSSSSPTIWTIAGTHHIKAIQSALRNLPTTTPLAYDLLETS